MFEILFIFAVIYLAYITYVKPEEGRQQEALEANKREIKEEQLEKVSSVIKEQEKETSLASIAPKVKKLATPKIELRTVEMKNPKTGEQAKVANNYRMVKRWIKEALVEEGLLDKIYKTKEMDDVAKAKVIEALSIIKAMDKYRVS